MSFYTIKDLERLSSQKAHTIRIWEQRYALLMPERTNGNIRYYNDEQLKKLLNVCALIGRGMKISHISKLTKAEMSAEIDKIIAGSYQDDVQIEAIINQALIAIATYDESRFNEIFSSSVHKLGLEIAYIRIIYPLLVRTGLMWTKDDFLPAQEHFLSNLIRQKLFAAIDSIELPGDADQTWILFLNEDEDHEIGLLFANYLLRQNGKKVIYLGARVPYSDLKNVIANCSPTHIYTFLVRNLPEEELSRFIKKLTTDFADKTICFSGEEEKIKRIVTAENVNYIGSIPGLLNLFNVNHAS